MGGPENIPRSAEQAVRTVPAGFFTWVFNQKIRRKSNKSDRILLPVWTPSAKIKEHRVEDPNVMSRWNSPEWKQLLSLSTPKPELSTHRAERKAEERRVAEEERARADKQAELFMMTGDPVLKAKAIQYQVHPAL